MAVTRPGPGPRIQRIRSFDQGEKREAQGDFRGTRGIFKKKFFRLKFYIGTSYPPGSRAGVRVSLGLGTVP